jgi:hypothetical protein
MSMSEWVMNNTRLRGKPFSFDRYEFQRQIIDDMHPDMAVRKCSQIGLSESQLRKYFAFLARTTAVNGIFTLPNDEMYKRFSQTRAKPLIEDNPVFNLGSGPLVRSMGLYQINKSFGYFVGNKPGDATSINADILLHDELDLSDQDIIGLFRSRLQGSAYRIIQRFSTPTLRGFGIDAAYAISDQHEFTVKCEHCRHHNVPEFTPTFVRIPGLTNDLNDLTELNPALLETADPLAAHLVCEKCGNPLNMHDVSLREWVPRYPTRMTRGYNVSPFSTRVLDVPYVIKELLYHKSQDTIQHWYNTVMGVAFDPANARLSELEIRTVMQGSKVPDTVSGPVAIGIDVGHTVCHVTLGNVGLDKPVVFDWQIVPSNILIDTVLGLCEQYNVVTGAIDKNPESVLANDVFEASNRRIVPVEYSSTTTAPPMVFVTDELDQLIYVKANRTRMLDAVASLIRKRNTTFVGYTQYERMIIDHLMDMARDDNGEKGAIWKKLTGKDHFFHSLAYLFYSVRIRDGILFKDDRDERLLSMITTTSIEMQNDALRLKPKNRTPSKLGLVGMY